MKHLTIGIFAPAPDDATSLYRAWGIVRDLKKQFLKMDVIAEFVKPENNLTYMNIKNYDVVYLQRPSTDTHLQIVEIAKRLGVKVWIDYDDNLFEIPVENQSYALYMNEKRHNTMKEIIKQSDLVTVSTQALSDYIKPWFFSNIATIQNAYDPSFHGVPIKQPTKNLIAWRGTNTHAKDIDTYKRPLVDFLNEYEQFKIIFMGFDAKMIRDEMKFKENYSYFELMDPVNYIANYKHLAPEIHIVPLHDSIFNRCKSNIALIEARASGAKVLGPAWNEWQDSDFCYYSEDSFYNGLTILAKGHQTKVGVTELPEQNKKRVEEILKIL